MRRRYDREVEDAVRLLKALGLLSREEFHHTIRRLEERMGAREDAAYEALNANIAAVKEGWASLTAERDALKAALEEADADKAAAVQDALDADSEVDASKVEAASAALDELAGHTEEPPVEEPPVEEPPVEEPPAEEPPVDDNPEEPAEQETDEDGNPV